MLGPNVGKDEESTAKATQVFHVTDCQPKALEVNVGKRCVHGWCAAKAPVRWSWAAGWARAGGRLLHVGGIFSPVLATWRLPSAWYRRNGGGGVCDGGTCLCAMRLRDVSARFSSRVCRKFFLSPGDHFFVPALSLYSMRNHSPSTPASVHFVIVSHNSPEVV